MINNPNLSEWTVPVLMTFWNELFRSWENNESDALLHAISYVEEELRYREGKSTRRSYRINRPFKKGANKVRRGKVRIAL